MKKTAARRAAAGLIVLLTAVGLYITLTNTSEGILTAYGIENLKFFTVDSNLLLGLAYLAELCLAGTGLWKRSARLRLWTERLIYIATVAVALTFTVVAVFFGPAVGYPPLYQDANLFFHLIVPVLGMVSLCVLHRGRPIPLGETAAALIPSVLYGAAYTANLLVRGARFPETDWYGFASGGVTGAAATAAGVLVTTWLLALLLRRAAGGPDTD